jgi:hyperosmotically inducible protein
MSRRPARGFAAIACAAALAVACERTEEGVRIHTAEAADRAGRTLEAAGDEVQKGVEELDRVAQPVVDDAAITAKVKAKLAADPEVHAIDIDVDTSDRVVTLSGSVEVAAHSAEAEKLARTTAGVRGVINRISVAGASAPPASPG